MFSSFSKVKGAPGRAGRIDVEDINTIANELINIHTKLVGIGPSGSRDDEIASALNNKFSTINTAIDVNTANLASLSTRVDDVSAIASNADTNAANIISGKTSAANALKLEGNTVSDILAMVPSGDIVKGINVNDPDNLLENGIYVYDYRDTSPEYPSLYDAGVVIIFNYILNPSDTTDKSRVQFYYSSGNIRRRECGSDGVFSDWTTISDYDSLNSDINTLESTVQSLDGEVDGLTARVGGVENSVTTINNDINTINNNLSTVETNANTGVVLGKHLVKWVCPAPDPRLVPFACFDGSGGVITKNGAHIMTRFKDVKCVTPINTNQITVRSFRYGTGTAFNDHYYYNLYTYPTVNDWSSHYGYDEVTDLTYTIYGDLATATVNFRTGSSYYGKYGAVSTSLTSDGRAIRFGDGWITIDSTSMKINGVAPRIDSNLAIYTDDKKDFANYDNYDLNAYLLSLLEGDSYYIPEIIYDVIPAIKFDDTYTYVTFLLAVGYTNSDNSGKYIGYHRINMRITQADGTVENNVGQIFSVYSYSSNTFWHEFCGMPAHNALRLEISTFLNGHNLLAVKSVKGSSKSFIKMMDILDIYGTSANSRYQSYYSSQYELLRVQIRPSNFYYNTQLKVVDDYFYSSNYGTLWHGYYAPRQLQEFKDLGAIVSASESAKYGTIFAMNGKLIYGSSTGYAALEVPFTELVLNGSEIDI